MWSPVQGPYAHTPLIPVSSCQAASVSNAKLPMAIAIGVRLRMLRLNRVLSCLAQLYQGAASPSNGTRCRPW